MWNMSHAGGGGRQQNASPPPGQLCLAYLYGKAMTGNALKLPHDLQVITGQVSQLAG